MKAEPVAPTMSNECSPPPVHPVTRWHLEALAEQVDDHVHVRRLALFGYFDRARVVAAARDARRARRALFARHDLVCDRLLGRGVK